MGNGNMREMCRWSEYLRAGVWAGAQLGTTYSSNDSGDRPPCDGCQKPLADARRICDSCYDKETPFSNAQCSLCHVRVGREENKRVKINATKLIAFNKYRYVPSDSTLADAFRQ